MNLRLHHFFLLVGAVNLLVGCTFLPSNGPSLSRVKSSANKKNHQGSYTLLPLNKKALSVLDKSNPVIASDDQLLNVDVRSATRQQLFRQTPLELFGEKVKNDTVMGGDVLDVTIFDAGGNLFATPIMPNGLSQTGAIPHALPPQLVDSSGEIMVPYAGRIMVRGRTLAQIQEEIQNKLKTKIVDPQVIVTMNARKGGDTISILGDIKTPSLIPLSLGGTHLLAAIAQAGGSIGKEYETKVTVHRGSTTRSALLSEIFETPSKNILLQFGDNVILSVHTPRFLSFGVNGRVNNTPFNSDHLMLDEALTMIGGPDYNAANPSAILIYRLEPRTAVAAMGGEPPKGEASLVPVIYRLDLTQADGFFLAHHFKMRDHDVIYTTSAGSMGILKFFHLLGGTVAPVCSAGGAAAVAL